MGKNIVICYDGTAKEYGTKNTNVVKLYRLLSNENGRQIAFYDPGVGTFNPFKPGAVRRWGRKVGIWWGTLFGLGLETNLRDGYRYLMNYYEQGDYLYLFGFSRGAYTARALAGMLHYFGLLEKGGDNLIPYVTEHYVKGELDVAEGFKNTFCRPCVPHLIGVWDTVRSLSYIGETKFYDAELKGRVKYGYHAVSIDEQRYKFGVRLWDEEKIEPDQTIEQVWFPGVHSDVGGGYAITELSDIALGWMLDRASDAGLLLKNSWPKTLQQKASGLLHDSFRGPITLLGKRPRTIPEQALIHQNVLDRRAQKPHYKPALPDEYEVITNPVYQQEQSFI